jgi:hypothetical protein
VAVKIIFKTSFKHFLHQTSSYFLDLLHECIVKPDDENVLLQMFGWLIAGGAEVVYAGKPQLCSHKCKDCSNKGREESEGEVRSVLLTP